MKKFLSISKGLCCEPHQPFKLSFKSGFWVIRYPLLVVPLVLFLALNGCHKAEVAQVDATDTIDLSVSNWGIWLDRDAAWVNDTLYTPPVNIKQLPVNPPTVGWDGLFENAEVETTLPATIEEYFWHLSGNERGISGDYRGVSWFFTKMDLPADWEGKNVFIDFESVRVRAEVFVNRQLAGYDLINGTPFSFNITEFVRAGDTNEIAVRITDPCGNFAWRDWDAFYWGDNLIPPSRGFGGITGRVQLRSADNTFLSDVFVKNLPDLNSVDVEFTVEALNDVEGAGKIDYQISKVGAEEVLTAGEIALDAFGGLKTVSARAVVENALPWSVEDPHLYLLTAEWRDEKGYTNTQTTRFGFRWFTVKEVDGDRMFFLNDKRVVPISAISWGHWPVNGLYPTKELARKQIESAKSLGLNMLHFHRAIGQTLVLDYADELGLMYYQEPGGYKPDDSQLIRNWKREKLLRMVKRDRNHPSLVIYNMINESTREPFAHELQDLADAHRVDETRIKTFTSTHFTPRFYNGACPRFPAPFKSHMLPYDTTIYDFGWWDEHHAGGPGVYADDFYDGPEKMHRHYDHPEEIVMLGEDGAVGTLPRLQLIKEELDKIGKTGWDGQQYLAQYEAFDGYLKTRGFGEAFPTVDALTKSIGVNSHYYHGRIIENFRVGNTGDSYVINGWENTKVENHSGIVDIFRNPKTDIKVLSHYLQPLYVAVKLRSKVFELGRESVADFFIVNEKDVKGPHVLQVKVKDREGVVWERNFDVNIDGGVRYGQLLMENIVVKPRVEGYTIVEAVLIKDNATIATGQDDIFTVELETSHFGDGLVVADVSGKVQSMLASIPGLSYTEYSPEQSRRPVGHTLIVGEEVQPGFVKGQFRMDCPVMDWVAEGNTLIITMGADVWCEHLEHKEVIEYYGRRTMGRDWYGGNFFVREHPLFNGLPVNTAFHWEYQALARYNRERFGLRLPDGESIVGAYADHKTEVNTAVAVVPLGRGKIIVSTLDIEGAIQSGIESAVVPKRILLNYILSGQQH